MTASSAYLSFEAKEISGVENSRMASRAQWVVEWFVTLESVYYRYNV